MNNDKNDISLEEELSRLREENIRLRKLLATHGIAWEAATVPVRSPSPEATAQSGNRLSTAEKVTLFRERFRGRTDVYPVRWESAKGNSGYSPACANEWRPGVCHKPKVKCGQCDQRLLLPVTDEVIYDHLAGKQTVGVYPLLPDDRCWFLAADFDDEQWEDDAKGFMRSCSELEIPTLLEISRSGNGAHVWIFFSEPVAAREARQLGAALISHTCSRTRQLSLASYDRLFPNQDTQPKGGFGNLIALPLQKQPRELGRSVFVDKHLAPYADQWALLLSICPLSAADLENAILRASGGRHPLDVSFTSDEDENKPWQRRTTHSDKLTGPLPESLHLVLANQIFLAKADVPQPLTNRLIRLAKVSTLVLVHRTELLRQWQERLSSFLELPEGGLGVIGAGKKRPSGHIRYRSTAVLISSGRPFFPPRRFGHRSPVVARSWDKYGTLGTVNGRNLE